MGSTLYEPPYAERAILRQLSAALADIGSGQAGYRALCSTLGCTVRVDLPSGSVEGIAEAVDDDGRLVVSGVAYGAGDVVHLRRLSSPP